MKSGVNVRVTTFAYFTTFDNDSSSRRPAARSEGKVYHFRIQRSTIGAYFVSDKLSFATLGELISYYQKNPRSLGVLLVEPCAQQVRHGGAKKKLKRNGFFFTSILVRTLMDLILLIAWIFGFNNGSSDW